LGYSWVGAGLEEVKQWEARPKSSFELLGMWGVDNWLSQQTRAARKGTACLVKTCLFHVSKLSSADSQEPVAKQARNVQLMVLY